jgi:hypothetical protein
VSGLVSLVVGWVLGRAYEAIDYARQQDRSEELASIIHTRLEVINGHRMALRYRAKMLEERWTKVSSAHPNNQKPTSLDAAVAEVVALENDARWFTTKIFRKLVCKNLELDDIFELELLRSRGGSLDTIVNIAESEISVLERDQKTTIEG